MMRITIQLNILFTILLISSFPGSADAQVVTRDTILLWRHFDYTLDQYHGMGSYSTSEIVEDEYPGIVMENEFVRLVVLPEFGARIASFYYKPTGHEQFYINPVGTPYGMNAGNFYYDWLMVFGGVFPTFPEPEHGKTWFLPWQWEITENTSGRVVLEMQLQDTINYPFHPGKFNNGVTEVRCISKVVLEQGKSSFDLEHTLQNTRSETVEFEYWTCTTLAPGSVPGNTYTPENSEIIAPIDHVYLKDDWWSWMGLAEVPAYELGNHVFEFNNLANFSNWENMGIAYAYPDITAEYYGVINHENSEGIFRVSDNAGVTPGMKFWTWGAQQGLNADPENFYDNARPYIELWSGLSTQFFEDAYLMPEESLAWTETYLPTAAMDQVSTVNEHGAIHASYTNSGSEQFGIKVFTSRPGAVFRLESRLEGPSITELYNDDLTSMETEANEFTFYLEDYFIEDGEYDLYTALKDEAGNILIEYTLPVTVPFPAQGVNKPEEERPGISRISENSLKLEFRDNQKRSLEVFTLDGKLVMKQELHNNSEIISLYNSGLYVLHITCKGQSCSFKVMM